jgi:sec-independent protein translocase protein TatA
MTVQLVDIDASACVLHGSARSKPATRIRQDRFCPFTMSGRWLSLAVTFAMIMNMAMLGILTMWEVVLLVALVMLLFGAKKLPELAKGLGQSIKEFKKSTSEDSDKTPPPTPR